MKLSANQQAIINALTTGCTTVACIAENSGLSKAAISANMKPLRDRGLITTTTKDGSHLVIELVVNEAKPAEPAKRPVAEMPTHLGARPRDIVQALIVSGYSKKIAKAHIYDNKPLR